jgi:hypothetical protein
LWTCSWIAVFQRNILPPFSGLKTKFHNLLGPHCVITQATNTDIFITIKTSNITYLSNVSLPFKSNFVQEFCNTYLVLSRKLRSLKISISFLQTWLLLNRPPVIKWHNIYGITKYTKHKSTNHIRCKNFH